MRAFINGNAECPVEGSTEYKNAKIYYLEGSDVSNFKLLSQTEAYSSGQDYGNKIYFYGYESQMKVIPNLLPSRDKKWTECEIVFPTNSASSTGYINHLYSKVNFVNVYGLRTDAYKLNSGVIDENARNLSLGILIYSVIILAFCIVLLVWRIFRCTCASAVAPQLRRAADKFEKRRDEEK